MSFVNCDKEKKDVSSHDGENKKFFAAAKVVAVVTVVSRVFGLARDMILARCLGASDFTSDFWTAFSIPNFFRRLFGEGALSAAFVPVFSKALELDGKQRASKLLANVMGLLAMFLCGLLILIEIGIVGAWAYLSYKNGGNYDGLIPVCLSIMMPFMVSICVVALCSAALNCVGRFVAAAAAPIVMNVVIICFALFITGRFDTERGRLIALSFSIPVTGIFQLLLIGTALKGAGLPVIPRLRLFEPQVREIITSMAPMMIPLGILQINALLDKVIARWFSSGDTAGQMSILGFEFTAPLATESATWMYYGEKLYQFPMGVLAISLATAVFPLFSRYAARGDIHNLKLSVNKALRLAIFEGLPSGAGLIVLSGLLVNVIFGGNKYTPADVHETAHVTFFYGLGMWAFCSQHILLRAFFAIGDRKTPLKIACWVVILNFLLNISLIWVPQVRQGAFGLGSSITQSINVILLIIILRKRYGSDISRNLVLSFVRTIVCASIMAAAGLGVLKVFSGKPEIITAAAAVSVSVIIFFVSAWILKAPELNELLHRDKSPIK